MSTLLDLQADVCEALNADEYLSQGGCKAFAEDKANVFAELDLQIETLGAVAITVLTPAGKALGSRNESGIPLEVPSLVIQCQEKPMLNREAPGHITALQAAQHIALVLDQPAFRFVDFIQGGDAEKEVVTVQVVFRTSITLTDPADSAEDA